MSQLQSLQRPPSAERAISQVSESCRVQAAHLLTLPNLSYIACKPLATIPEYITRGNGLPFLAPWKKNRTMNTCNPAMKTIIPLSTTLKLNILASVLFTVLKFLFSLVRKYFWFRLMVERSRDTFKIDSSSAEVCSGEADCFEGRRAEGPSPSIWMIGAISKKPPFGFYEVGVGRGMDVQRSQNRPSSQYMCSSHY